MYISKPNVVENGELRYISKYLVQFVPDTKPQKKEEVVRISGARVSTSDKCASILREHEEKKQKEKEGKGKKETYKRTKEIRKGGRTKKKRQKRAAAAEKKKKRVAAAEKRATIEAEKKSHQKPQQKQSRLKN